MADKELKIVKLLEDEIEWTFKNLATNLSKEFQDGFRSGITQAINIINEYFEKVKNG